MKRNHLTVIFMKDTNQPLTYQISVRLLIMAVVLLVGIASTYAFFIRGYYSLYRDNMQLEEILRALKTDMGTLQTTISHLKEQQTEPSPTAVVQPEIATTGQDQPTTPTVHDKPVKEMARQVAIDRLTLKADHLTGSLKFSFVLDNATNDGSLLRGYLFVVLKRQSNDKLSSFPDVAFKDGFPADYHQGDRYAIRRFKSYRGELMYTPDASILEILVYSDTGTLIVHLKKPAPTS